jgi:ABC-2 type transport system permease protein
VSLTLVHARFQLIETMRIPIALVGNMLFPAVAMIAFVVPIVGDDPQAATFATASMITYAVMSSNLFQYGVGVADDRTHPWDPYTRTLPAGPAHRFAGRILAGSAMTLMSLVLVVVIAAVATAATSTPLAFLAGVVTTVLIAIPFMLMGLSIGYALPAKAAVVAAQVLFFPLAFCGGLFSAPGGAPGFVAVMAPYLPTGAAAELMWAAVGDYPFHVTSMITVAVWAVALAALAAWAYRRDEGRRFS